jgi:hypothetical protein
MNSKETYQKLYQIEKELSLFEKKICGVYFWKLIRFDIFRTINCSDLYKEQVSFFIENRYKRFLRIIYNSVFHSIFNSKRKVNYIFFENPRKIKAEQEKYIDPYTHYFIKNKFREGSFEIIDDGYNGVHYEKASDFRKFSESIYFDILYKLFIKFFNKKLQKEELILLDKIEKRINSEFNICVDLTIFTINAIKNFSLQYKKYRTLLKKKTPSEIYIVCSYGKEGLIHAANKQGVVVIELQHGLISEYHAGYSFQGNSVPYFPDKVLLFGWYWYDSSSIPLQKSSVSVIGYDYFNQENRKYSRSVKVPKSVLIVSQPSLGDSLLIKSLELAASNRNYIFIYRLHPKEKSDFRRRYSRVLNMAQGCSNLVFEYCEKPLYELFSETEFLIGVSSTSVYEALAFKMKIILIDIAKNNDMSFLTDNNIAHLFGLKDDINLDKISFLGDAQISYFFHGVGDLEYA